MRGYSRTISRVFVFTLLASALAFSSVASAQVALDDDDDATADDAPATPAAGSSVTDDADKVTYGVGLRLRYTFIPNGIIEAFVKHSAGGNANMGFGLEGIRKRGDLEMTFGFEYESLKGNEDVWIDNKNAADLVEYDGFGWITFDFSFIWHTKLTDLVSLRYGGGAGLGIVMGNVLQTDYLCSPPDNAGNCMMDPLATTTGDFRAPQKDIPPVFPVVNILAGVQIHPTKKVAINIEGGIRTVFYVGTTLSYFF